MTEEEKQIVETAPDYENQLAILEEEHNADKRKRKWYIAICSILLFVVLIFTFSYSFIYVYRPYNGIGNDNCENVNIKINGSSTPNINIFIGSGRGCRPMYNIDYYNNRKATFNIDVYGDRSFIFNKTNQMDPTGKYCVLNCDRDNDGWPDYNIDLDGDGKADINIILDPKNPNKNVCDRNCDINFDTIPDTNIFDDATGKLINEYGEDYRKPIYNIDYMGNNKPVFNVDINGDKTNLYNKMNQMDSTGKYCVRNCDIDGDGWPDYNITLTEDGPVLNELINTGNDTVPYLKGRDRDWKCNLVPNLDHCKTNKTTTTNTYINIDVDGDGDPDVNISNDGGQTITNPINKPGKLNGNDVLLNYDKDNDGFPDYNIDINNDGIPDLNITKDGSYECVKNCDYNSDGKGDYNIDVNDQNQELIHIGKLNIDIDYDKTCDINCDLNNDLWPDINIDVDGDGIPDLNIDYDNDGKPDFNIDTNGDGIPEKNLDAYGIGKCNFNCENGNGELINKVNDATGGKACNRNCDTDGDGWPDTNVYMSENDIVCSFNCGNEETKDTDHDYYLDSETTTKKAILDIIEKNESDFYILNPVDIYSENIEPGWSDNYVLEIRNTSNHAVKYKIYWKNVTNEFTDANNLVYNLTRNGTKYILDSKAPRTTVVLKDQLILKDNAAIKYVLDINFIETNVNQNIDSGKNFKGQLIIDMITN